MHGGSRARGTTLARLIVLPLSAVVALAATTAASAEPVVLQLTVSPGSLSLVPTSVRLSQLRVKLDGRDHALTSGVGLMLLDSTGSGSGWHVMATSTMVVTNGHRRPRPLRDALTVTKATIRCAPGGSCIAPRNSIRYPLVVPAGATPPPPVRVLQAAADSGLGRFTVVLGLRLKVPGSARSGEYSTTLLLSVASGP
jgi:hypothetical protein